MKKEYLEPEAEWILFSEESVITASDEPLLDEGDEGWDVHHKW